MFTRVQIALMKAGLDSEITKLHALVSTAML